jgi:septal ring factor EnvC (AmiA/AmiB activator)
MLRHFRLFGLTAAILALGSGCVSKKKYTELETVLAKTREAVKDRDAERRDLEARLEVCAQDQKQLAECQEDLARIIAEKGQLNADIQDMTAALVELARQQKEAEARIAEYRAVVEKFRALEAAGKLKVRIVDGRCSKSPPSSPHSPTSASRSRATPTTSRFAPPSFRATGSWPQIAPSPS